MKMCSNEKPIVIQYINMANIIINVYNVIM
jgi:hypothetical protein